MAAKLTEFYAQASKQYGVMGRQLKLAMLTKRSRPKRPGTRAELAGKHQAVRAGYASVEGGLNQDYGRLFPCSRLQEGPMPQTEKGAGQPASLPLLPGCCPTRTVSPERAQARRQRLISPGTQHQFLFSSNASRARYRRRRRTPPLHIKLRGWCAGQLEKALMPSRTSWSSSTFTALNLTPIWDRICTVTAELASPRTREGEAILPFIYRRARRCSSTIVMASSNAGLGVRPSEKPGCDFALDGKHGAM